jgi:hypothetical protein
VQRSFDDDVFASLLHRSFMGDGVATARVGADDESWNGGRR